MRRRYPLRVALVADDPGPDAPTRADAPPAQLLLSTVRAVLEAGGHEVSAVLSAASADPAERVPELVGALLRAWRSDRPDVVHAYGWPAGMAALGAARELGVPVVAAFPEPGDGDARSVRLEAATGRSAAAVLAPSAAEVERLTRLGVPRHVVALVPAAVPVEVFTPDGPSVPLGTRLVAVAPPHGADELVRALRWIPGAALTLVGGSAADEADTLRKEADRIGAADRLTLRGGVTRAELPALLRGADAALCGAWSAATGRPALEAMSCGVPVIAPELGAYTDVVVHEVTGLLVPPGDPAALGQAARRLLGDPVRLAGFRLDAAERVRARYTLDHLGTALDALHRRIVAV